MSRNALTLKFYDTSGVEVVDADKIGARSEGIGFDTIYPGGMGAASWFTPCDVTRPLSIRGGYRVKAYNSAKQVYEGIITNIGYVYSADGRQGVQVEATGPWGWYFGETKLDKRWADNRITADVWVDAPPTGYSDANRDLFSVDRTDRLKIETKAGALAINDGRSLTYSQPAGQTTKRFKLSGNMQEGAQAYTLRAYNVTGAANIWSKTASGTFTQDDTLGTPTQHLFVQFYGNAVQTPTYDNKYFGQIDDAVSGAAGLMVYSETGSINCYEVFLDVLGSGLLSAISSDTSLVSSALNVSVEPFFTTGPEALSSILARIAAYGDASNGQIGYGVWESAKASDGKPILFAESWPALTDYDIIANVSNSNVGPSFRINEDYSQIFNYITVAYTNPDGTRAVVTPNEDATLKDQTSIDRYGERHIPQSLDIGYGTQALAVLAGRRYLSQSKNPKFYVAEPIVFTDYALGKHNTPIPSSSVRAGMRVKVSNYVSDRAGVDGAGMTFVLTQTHYNDDTGQLTAYCGTPDNMAVYLARSSLNRIFNASPGDYRLGGR